ncbi:MAG: ATP-binding protein [bacterium]|nr:ATP-binding protein [bacterium]
MAMATEKMNTKCEKCGGTGWILVTEDEVELVRRCECAEKIRRQGLLETAAIPERYHHCTLDSFNIWDKKNKTLARSKKAVREYVDLYPETEKQGLLLMGPVGTGKTHLAVAALQELIEGKGVRGCFADFTSLVLEIQMTFGETGGSRELLQPLVEAELLVLDELGAGKTSQWVLDLLYYLVNRRYLERRATIFTTNLKDPTDSPKAGQEYLADRVSRRIRSRLFEMCEKIELVGGDFRKHQYAHPRYEKNA